MRERVTTIVGHRPSSAVQRAAATPGALDGVRGPLRNRSGTAVFLCYHSIAAAGPPFITVSPETLECQLEDLRRRGFVAGRLAAVPELAAGRRPERPQAFLTFDDGYVDNFETAFPILRGYGFSPLVFVLPPYVDAAAAFDWPEVATARAEHPALMRSMDWAMVEEMAEAGVEFGSHTCSHPHLPRLGDEQLRQELLDSRRRLRDRLGRCDALAYPFGDWSPRVAAAAAESGYSFAFSLPLGGQRTASPFAIPRINVDHRDWGLRFRAKLSPASRWLFLSPAKVLVRRARSLRHGRDRAGAGRS